MSVQATARLREVHTQLASFDGPAAVSRADELAGVLGQLSACAVQFADVSEPDDLQERLASAGKALWAAEKAARTHRRNPLTRPLSQLRFALNLGKAHGWIEGVLEKLDPTFTPTPPPKGP